MYIRFPTYCYLFTLINDVTPKNRYIWYIMQFFCFYFSLIRYQSSSDPFFFFVVLFIQVQCIHPENVLRGKALDLPLQHTCCYFFPPTSIFTPPLLLSSSTDEFSFPSSATLLHQHEFHCFSQIHPFVLFHPHLGFCMKNLRSYVVRSLCFLELRLFGIF